MPLYYCLTTINIGPICSRLEEGPSLHSEEYLCLVDYNFLLMSPSYDLILGHIADFLHVLSDAPSFWFTLNSSYDHDFHLSKRFGMSPREYECLLIAADLASYTKKKRFAIKPKWWQSFITGHHFTNMEGGNIELDSKQFDIDAMINGTPSDIKKRVFHHVIRIGVKYKDYHPRIEWQKDNLGRMVTTPPRLNKIWTNQQSFRKSVEPFIWNFIIDNDFEEEGEEDQRHYQSNANVEEHQRLSYG